MPSLRFGLKYVTFLREQSTHAPHKNPFPVSCQVRKKCKDSGSHNASSCIDDVPSKSSSKPLKPLTFTYSKKDSILYALGVGCGADELRWVWEGAQDFQTLPSFGVLPGFAGMMAVDMGGVLENFSPVMLLHGEQFIELMRPEGLPTEGTLRCETQLVAVDEKAGGKGTVVVAQVTCKDASSGAVLAVAEGSTFNRQARAKASFTATAAAGAQRRPLAVEAFKASQMPTGSPPHRTQKQRVADSAAALYRLSGDANPLHIDPQFAQAAGFPRPILHGLCTLGMATHHVAISFLDQRIRAIRVRFVKHVFPGDEIETQMWRVSPTRVVFKVIKNGSEAVIDQSFIEFFSSDSTGKGEAIAGKEMSSTQPKSNGVIKEIVGKFEGLPESVKAAQVKKIGGVFEFKIGADAGNGDVFYFDLKNGKGAVGVGAFPGPGKADITVTVPRANDFQALVSGQLKGQEAFMKGAVKIKGNMMMAMKLDSLFKSLGSSSGSSKM